MSGVPMTTSQETRPPGAVVRVDVYSHHFRLSHFERGVKDALFEYCRRVAKYGMVRQGNGRFVRGMVKVFVGVTRDREEFSFHINEFDEVVAHLGRYGIASRQLWLVPHPLYEPASADMNYIDHRTPRQTQGEMIDYIQAPGRTKIITLAPGGGKTFVTSAALAKIRQRSFFCIKPRYIEKWIGDLKESFQLDKHELMVVRGSRNFKQLLELGAAGELEANFILCSNSTYFQYLKNYEVYKNKLLELGYPCLPWNMLETLGVGIRVIDEVHQDFHLNFRQDLYSHVPKTLSLTGTLESDDQFINGRNEVMFPYPERFHNNFNMVHVKAEALVYQMPRVDERGIKYMNHALKSYNHVRFEQSIMKKKKLLNSYFEMVFDILKRRFIERREPEQKIVIYFSTIDMCTLATEFIKERAPQANVIRYVGEDEYKKMLKGEIIVTTLKSLGTAIDVPDLRMILLTDAISSRQANLQCMGRLRPLKRWPDTAPEFLYLVNTDIQKHRDYHLKKIDVFRGQVVSHHETMTSYVL